MKNTSNTIKVLFWSTVAIIDAALILSGALCFAIIGTAAIAYIYYLVAPLIISFIERKMKDIFVQNQMLNPASQSLRNIESTISTLSQSHLINRLKNAFYVFILIFDIIFLYTVLKDYQSSSEMFRFHLAVLSYFIIIQICLKQTWIPYSVVLTLTMLVVYFKFLHPFVAILLPLLLVVFIYTIYTVLGHNQHRIGTLSLKLSLMPLVFMGSFYLILEFGFNRAFSHGAEEIFLSASIMCGVPLSTILFILGIGMKVAGYVQGKAEYR